MYFELEEAQLFRILCGFFGTERVIAGMSIFAICSGITEYPFEPDSELKIWTKANKCLFTVVDQDDKPRIVLEFSKDIREVIDTADLEREVKLKPLLESRGIAYLTISNYELAEICDPAGTVDFFHWLKDKVDDGFVIGC